jgi:hypothetical protein
MQLVSWKMFDGEKFKICVLGCAAILGEKVLKNPQSMQKKKLDILAIRHFDFRNLIPQSNNPKKT